MKSFFSIFSVRLLHGDSLIYGHFIPSGIRLFDIWKYLRNGEDDFGRKLSEVDCDQWRIIVLDHGICLTKSDSCLFGGPRPKLLNCTWVSAVTERLTFQSLIDVVDTLHGTPGFHEVELSVIPETLPGGRRVKLQVLDPATS